MIELALARRSELDLDELSTILERLGIEVDTDTLVADLDALGYDIDDTFDDDDVDDAPGPTRTAGDPLSDDALADAIRSDPPRPIERHAPLAVVAAAVLVIIVAAVVIVGGADDGETETASGQNRATSAEGGAANPGATTAPAEPVRTAPPGLGPDPALTEPDLAFDFGVDSAVLPAPADGTQWEPFSGDFEVVGGRAVSTEPGEPGILVGIDGPTPDARIQVALPDLSEAAGLAFRIGDGGTDFYAWVVAPAYSTVNLYRVTPAGREVVANSGVTPVSPGMTLGVNLTGTTAELLANGVVVASVEDIGTSARWGLTALAATTPGVFDDLLVQYA